MILTRHPDRLHTTYHEDEVPILRKTKSNKIQLIKLIHLDNKYTGEIIYKINTIAKYI